MAGRRDASSAGFRELSHTADVEIEVWAPDLPGLLVQAARGMYALAGIRLEAENRLERAVELRARDGESLLVSFLTELLYLCEVEGLAFDDIRPQVDGYALQARLGGAPVASQRREIKAVTYHDLAVRASERGYEARIVFDV